MGKVLQVTVKEAAHQIPTGRVDKHGLSAQTVCRGQRLGYFKGLPWLHKAFRVVAYGGAAAVGAIYISSCVSDNPPELQSPQSSQRHAAAF